MHRKNSSESSEEIQIQPAVKIVAYHPKVPEKKRKLANRRSKPQCTQTDGAIAKDDGDKQSVSKPYQDHGDGIRLHDGSENLVQGPRRHSNFTTFTNSTYGFIGSTVQPEIKPTGSLELGYIDKNPNQALTGDGFYFTQPSRGGVRRIRSTALEICCPPPPLTVHPNSLEVIGGNVKGTKNPLPPPSSTLVRNQHLNLCPYYGSEIVYPIAEQSDEHQTSHGPDSDLESLNQHNSDSDYEENQPGSGSPLLFRLDQMNLAKVPTTSYSEGRKRTKDKSYKNDEERTSATSKDALLDNENSNSSVTPELRTDCCENNKICNCSNLSLSNTSVDCEETMLEKSKSKQRNAAVKDVGGRGGGGGDGERVQEEYDGVIVVSEYNPFKNCAKRGGDRTNRKRKSSGSMKSVDGGNCSSLVGLDLDWLFDDENERLKHSKGELIDSIRYM